LSYVGKRLSIPVGISRPRAIQLVEDFKAVLVAKAESHVYVHLEEWGDPFIDIGVLKRDEATLDSVIKLLSNFFNGNAHEETKQGDL
jgi:hypothetical protein